MQEEFLEQDRMIWDFLSHGYTGGRILAAECSTALLEKMKELSPAPEVVLWSDEEQRAFCRNRWPEEMEGNFRYVLLGRLAERLEDIHALRDLQEYLAYNGVVLSLWGNVQHWTVVRNLLDGNWHYSANPVFQEMPHRLFSKKEILDTFRLLRYREVHISYLEQGIDDPGLRKLQAQELVEDPASLRVAFWCVEAQLFNREITALRGQLTSGLRKELGRALRRIENDIEPEVNCAMVWEFCQSRKVSEEYLAAFVRSVTAAPQAVWDKLRTYVHE